MLGTHLGPYRIDGELGSGGMGRVYAATVVERAAGLDDGQRVALKVIHPHLLETPGFFRRFVREGEIGRAVAHENVVRTVDSDALLIGEKTCHFLVMEYVEGQTLRQLLDELDRLPENLCRHVGREIAKGLSAIHDAGIVHRDLKPDNVIVTADHAVKVMDLGVARLQDEIVRLSQTGAFVGSLHYAAPEQFGDRSRVDHRADIHALGLLLYEIAGGQHPYYDEDIRTSIRRLLHEQPRRLHEVNPQLSPFYDELVHVLIAKDPAERIGTAAEVGEILKAGESSEWWLKRVTALRIETKRPLRRLRVPRETALYGREPELRRLRSLFDRAKAGEGGVLLIEGEAGIGKTRLVDEFAGGLLRDGEDADFLFGSYPPSGAATAAGALSTAFREYMGPEGSAPYLTETPLLAPGFDAVLHGTAAPAGSERLTREFLGTCFVHATRALAAVRPVILLIDDLHFAPQDALGLFATLALAIPGHRVLLVGTMRPGVPEDWLANISRLDHASHATLSRLGPKDLALLLEESFRSKRLAQELGHQIALMSDGNPFFAFEIIRGLREGQFIRQSKDGSWDSTRTIAHIDIPSSVLDLVNARVADLDEEERELLDVAACCGYEFDPRLIGDVVGVRPIPLLRALARVERRHRLVRSAGLRFVFDHHQVQEALYGGLPEALKREYHGALAAALEAREEADAKDPAALDGGLCAALCEHFFRGARGERALRYLHAALDYLDESLLSDDAIDIARRALDTPGLVRGAARVELLLRQATHLDSAGRRDDERAALDEALALAEQLPNEPRALRRVEVALGGHHFRCARYPEASSVLEHALELAVAAQDEEVEVTATRNLGNVSLWQGRYRDACAQFERALVLSRQTGDRRQESSAIGSLGNALNRLGQHEAALEHYERSLEIACEIGFRAGEATARGNLSLALRRLGRYDEAERHHERALELSRRLGNRRGEAADASNLGNLFFSLGRYDEARSQHERTLTLARETGDRRWEDLALHNLGNALIWLGRPDSGRELLETSRRLADAIGDRGGVDYGDWLLGDLAAWAGEPERAERLLRGAADNFRASGTLDEVAGVLVSLGTLMASQSRHAEAAAHLEEAVRLAEETNSSGALVLAHCHLAVLRGDAPTAAESAFTEHDARLEHNQRTEARYLLWTATHDAAHLQAAQDLLAEALANNPEEHHEAMLANVPLHHDVAAAWHEHGSSAGAVVNT